MRTVFKSQHTIREYLERVTEPAPQEEIMEWYIKCLVEVATESIMGEQVEVMKKYPVRSGIKEKLNSCPCMEE